MASQRGRKCQITEAQFLSIIERYRDQLVEDDHLVNRYDPIWSELEECASKMGACLKASSFHTHVHGNRYNVKTDILLLDNNTVDRYKTLEFDASDNQDPSYKADDLSSDDQRVTFEFSISRDEMKAITEFRSRNLSKGGKRMWHVFKSGVYQDFFINMIFAASRLRCGFNFQRTYIDMSGTSGNLRGEFSHIFESSKVLFYSCPELLIKHFFHSCSNLSVQGKIVYIFEQRSRITRLDCYLQLCSWTRQVWKTISPRWNSKKYRREIGACPSRVLQGTTSWKFDEPR